MLIDELDYNALDIYNRFVKIIQNTDLKTKNKAEEDILNLIDSLDSESISYISDLISILKEDYPIFGFEDKNELSIKYGLMDNYDNYHNFEIYNNDYSLLKLIFSETLFAKIASFEKSYNGAEKAIELIDKVFDIARKTDIYEYSILFLFRNLKEENFKQYPPIIKQLLVAKVCNIIIRNINNENLPFILSKIASDYIYNLNVKNDDTFKFIVSMLKSLNSSLVEEINKISLADNGESAIDKLAQEYNTSFKKILNTLYIREGKRNIFEEDSDDYFVSKMQQPKLELFTKNYTKAKILNYNKQTVLLWKKGQKFNSIREERLHNERRNIMKKFLNIDKKNKKELKRISKYNKNEHDYTRVNRW